MEKEHLEAGLKKVWDARDDLLSRHQRYWYDKMSANRKRMNLPELEFDPKKNYIPVSIKRDTMGIPIKVDYTV